MTLKMRPISLIKHGQWEVYETVVFFAERVVMHRGAFAIRPVIFRVFARLCIE